MTERHTDRETKKEKNKDIDKATDIGSKERERLNYILLFERERERKNGEKTFQGNNPPAPAFRIQF